MDELQMVPSCRSPCRTFENVSIPVNLTKTRTLHMMMLFNDYYIVVCFHLVAATRTTLHYGGAHRLKHCLRWSWIQFRPTKWIYTSLCLWPTNQDLVVLLVRYLGASRDIFHISSYFLSHTSYIEISLSSTFANLEQEAWAKAGIMELKFSMGTSTLGSHGRLHHYRFAL